MHIATVNKERGHDLKREQEAACGRVWRKKKGGKNNVIIILKSKKGFFFSLSSGS